MKTEFLVHHSSFRKTLGIGYLQTIVCCKFVIALSPFYKIPPNSFFVLYPSDEYKRYKLRRCQKGLCFNHWQFRLTDNSMGNVCRGSIMSFILVVLLGSFVLCCDSIVCCMLYVGVLPGPIPTLPRIVAYFFFRSHSIAHLDIVFIIRNRLKFRRIIAEATTLRCWKFEWTVDNDLLFIGYRLEFF